MTLVVEDGTGLADAEAYLSVADYRTMAAKFGYDVTGHSDGECETDLRHGFRYINTIGRYKAITLTLGQAGEFPRDGLTDYSGRAVTGVPRAVKEAQAYLAFRSHSEELYADVERGGRVASESVGPISVSYFADAPAGKTYRAAMALLKPLMRSTQEAYAPFIGGTAGQTSTEDAATSLTPIFGIGFMSNDSD